MRLTLVLSLLGLAGAASLAAQVPVMNRVAPEAGKVGSVLKIQGAFLDKTKVDEVYLSDHTFDMKVKVLDQTEDSIVFRIPPFAKPGRLQLVVRTKDKEPVILEQPLYITVEEKTEASNSKEAPKETAQATATSAPPANAQPAASGTK
jgi:hypothetical protein